MGRSRHRRDDRGGFFRSIFEQLFAKTFQTFAKNLAKTRKSDLRKPFIKQALTSCFVVALFRYGAEIGQAIFMCYTALIKGKERRRTEAFERLTTYGQAAPQPKEKKP